MSKGFGAARLRLRNPDQTQYFIDYLHIKKRLHIKDHTKKFLGKTCSFGETLKNAHKGGFCGLY